MPETSVFHHHFDRVEDYLHHRSPWLMVDSINEIQAASIRTTKIISLQEPFFPAHFPGAPIVPGSMLQEMTTQTGGILLAARFNPMHTFNTHDPQANEYALGVLVRVKETRFRGFARPGSTLNITVDLQAETTNVFEFRGAIELGGRTILTNRFQLANIPSELLLADEPAALST